MPRGRALFISSGPATSRGQTAIAIVSGVLLSELASNTASAGMHIPLVIAIAQADHVSPIAPPSRLSRCGCGFALPVSTPPNAIVYGTGLIPIRSMILADCSSI